MSHFDGKTWSQGVTDKGNTAVCVWRGFVGLSGFDEECYASVDGVWMNLQTSEPTSVEMADDLDSITAPIITADLDSITAPITATP
jgi:hypothetical protein